MIRGASTFARLALGLALTTACGPERATNASAPNPERSAQEQPATPTTDEAQQPASPVQDPAGSGDAGFLRFRMTGDDAACPRLAKGDCKTVVELTAEGALTLDPWGAPGAEILRAQLAAAEVEQAAPSLTAPELLTLLDHDPPCEGADQTETMEVHIAGRARRGATGACNDPPIQAVRKVMLDLTHRHFPDHHLISPPF